MNPTAQVNLCMMLKTSLQPMGTPLGCISHAPSWTSPSVVSPLYWLHSLKASMSSSSLKVSFSIWSPNAHPRASLGFPTNSYDAVHPAFQELSLLASSSQKPLHVSLAQPRSFTYAHALQCFCWSHSLMWAMVAVALIFLCEVIPTPLPWPSLI